MSIPSNSSNWAAVSPIPHHSRGFLLMFCTSIVVTVETVEALARENSTLKSERFDWSSMTQGPVKFPKQIPAQSISPLIGCPENPPLHTPQSSITAVPSHTPAQSTCYVSSRSRGYVDRAADLPRGRRNRGDGGTVAVTEAVEEFDRTAGFGAVQNLFRGRFIENTCPAGQSDASEP